MKRDLIDDMVSYMKYGAADDENDPEYDLEFDAGYKQEHIDRCLIIIDELLSLLEKTPETRKDKYILSAVKKAVLSLNKLNEECDYSLIETYQRDCLGVIINSAAQHAGLEASETDITLEWREW